MSSKRWSLIKSTILPVHLLLWVAGGVTVLILLAFVALFFVDEPLRRYMERGINQALDGYTVTLQKVDLNPLLVSVTLQGIVLRQDGYPDPPVAVFPEYRMSLHWREIFSGRLVADWQIRRPEIYINLKQLKKENEDDVPVEERGWQEAVKHVFPLKLNQVEITGGKLTYIDQDPDRPLRLSRVHLTATNIRNIDSPDAPYPSPFRLEADIFDQGHGVMEGHANFLAQPHIGVKSAVELRNVPLEKLGPLAARANLSVNGGVLGGRGSFEYAPKVKNFHLADLEVGGLKIDYVHSAQTAAAEKKRAAKAKEKAKEAAEETKEPGTSFLIDRLRLTGEAGMVNKATDPGYRVYLSNAELVLTNLSDEFRNGAAEATLKGFFMGNGATGVKGVFRPRKKGADLDLRLRIEGTRVTSMNDLLRAHGNFDVVAGSFSVYSEVHVRGDRIEGYVKPFFKDLDVYDPKQEENKGLLQKVYEAVVGGVGQLLENPREAVATRADISGTLENPEANTWQIIVQLVRNGFIRAILPGFEPRASGGKK